MKSLFSIMPNVQTNHNFKLDFKKMDQNAGQR